MPNFAYPSSTSPSRSPRMPQGQKWTVSPEFGDALMTAMRERTESGGPIPRLPSLLQLPALDNIHSKPGPSPEISPDNTKLTMKTRVAVRDKTPHRFQVVPLREIGSLALPAQDTMPLSRTRGGALSTAKLHIYGGNKTRTLSTNENSVAATIKSQDPKPAMPERRERTRTLSERNSNIPTPENPSFEIQISRSTISLNLSGEQPTQLTPTHQTLFPSNHEGSEMVQHHSIATHRSSMPARSILRTRNANEHDYSHFKSPSLGNLHEKPPLSQQHDYSTLPRVRCRKRTNTLSVDNSTRLKHDLTVCEETKILERRRPMEHNALKRHAIYTQSLYVPHDERDSSGRVRLASESKRPSFLDAKKDTSYLDSCQHRTSKSSLQSNSSATCSSRHVRSLSGNYNALGLVDVPLVSRSIFPSSSLTQGFSSDSQSSISSIYSQDGLSLNSQNSQATLTQTRPLAQSRFSSDYQLVVRRQTRELGKGMIAHHPIIVGLLAEVDEALKEWQSIL